MIKPKLNQLKLKAAKNLRWKKVCVCATCKFCQLENGAIFCKRENGIKEDVGDMRHWVMVCDRWAENVDIL